MQCRWSAALLAATSFKGLDDVSAGQRPAVRIMPKKHGSPSNVVLGGSKHRDQSVPG